MQEASKGDKQRPTNHVAYVNNYDTIFVKRYLSQPKHEIKSDGLSTHNGEYWYKCTKCGASDWIASNGTLTQLNFYDNTCKA